MNPALNKTLEDAVSDPPALVRMLRPYVRQALMYTPRKEFEIAVSYLAPGPYKFDLTDERFINLSNEELFMFICFVLLAEDRWPF